MYQPRRATGALDAERPGVDAFEGAPRRAARRPAAALTSRLAPALASLVVLGGAGGVAVTVNAGQDTRAVPAPVRAVDTTSRSEARTAAEPTPSATPSEASGEALAASEPAEAETTEDVAPTPEPTADDAFVGGSWADAFGTVTGTQFAQKALEVRAQSGDGAAVLGKLASGDKVSVTDKVVDGWTQVAFNSQVGWIRSELLGAKAPVKEAPKEAAGGSGQATARTSGKLQWPTAGSIGSRWGMRKHPILGYTRMHGGVDIGGRVGQPIYAAEDGVVTKAAHGHNSGSGNNVRIDHGKLSGKSVETAYLHMSKISVKAGQKVRRGQVIGTVGNTGLSTSPHLHFSVYLNGANSNPAPWLG